LLQVVDDIIKTTGNRQVEFMKLDLASFKSIRAFAEELDQPGHRVDKLHVLVNNAGLAQGPSELTGETAWSHTSIHKCLLNVFDRAHNHHRIC